MTAIPKFCAQDKPVKAGSVASSYILSILHLAEIIQVMTKKAKAVSMQTSSGLSHIPCELYYLCKVLAWKKIF